MRIPFLSRRFSLHAYTRALQGLSTHRNAVLWLMMQRIQETCVGDESCRDLEEGEILLTVTFRIKKNQIKGKQLREGQFEGEFGICWSETRSGG